VLRLKAAPSVIVTVNFVSVAVVRSTWKVNV
jgi:hypothetical protein